ncbi:MAG: type I restriction enzyme HsdR N-terminal domain-containing protein [Gammaproteobacteria bacterium]|nr:type I restriction enzyme HsdR N-terminal domain-containing protein [Gammaproteobacteria bacterium]
MFEGITPKLFEDPNFKEDSVRELIVTPILDRLGFSPHGPARVVRSKTLSHPFIRVGTSQHPVRTVPDYTLFVDERPALILDAKSPTQSVRDKVHIQQAYSYAIHPKIGCEEFALCNGPKLAVFSVKTQSAEPLLELGFAEYDSRWTDIEKLLGPRYLRRPELRRFVPDYGMALHRIGVSQETTIDLYGTKLDFFAKLNSQVFTSSANTFLGTVEYCATFDFSTALFDKVLESLPFPLGREVHSALTSYPFKTAKPFTVELDLAVKLGRETQGQDESFRPLLVQSVEAVRRI